MLGVVAARAPRATRTPALRRQPVIDDEIAGEPVLIVFQPAYSLGVAHSRRLPDGRVLTFSSATGAPEPRSSTRRQARSGRASTVACDGRPARRHAAQPAQEHVDVLVCLEGLVPRCSADAIKPPHAADRIVLRFAPGRCTLILAGPLPPSAHPSPAEEPSRRARQPPRPNPEPQAAPGFPGDLRTPPVARPRHVARLLSRPIRRAGLAAHHCAPRPRPRLPRARWSGKELDVDCTGANLVLRAGPETPHPAPDPPHDHLDPALADRRPARRRHLLRRRPRRSRGPTWSTSCAGWTAPACSA